jgi:hypothetical protein
LEAERVRAERERADAASELLRMRQEMEAMQHELLLASELSTVNGLFRKLFFSL